MQRVRRRPCSSCSAALRLAGGPVPTHGGARRHGFLVTAHGLEAVQPLGAKPMHMGGLTLAMARMAAGMVQMPSPAISPDATAADSSWHSAALAHCHTSMMMAARGAGPGAG